MTLTIKNLLGDFNVNIGDFTEKSAPKGRFK
jgi:hypothetical protein